MKITSIKTGSTLVSDAVPDRSTHRWKLAYTGLFQSRRKRILLPVKCFYVEVAGHHILIDAGWSKEVVDHPIKHLGIGLWFASEPVMQREEAAVNQLKDLPVDSIYMTHLDSDHASGLNDFIGVPVYASGEEIEAVKKNGMRYGKLTSNILINAISFAVDENAPFGRSADVFGDGSVIAYLTPTHSHGSVIYKINGDNKFALIVGDNGYNEEAWKQGILPGPLFHADNMKKCLAWINQQSTQNNCCGIYCAHDSIDR